MSAMPRKNPSWMNPAYETDTTSIRFLPNYLTKAVDEMVSMVDELHDNDRGWLPEDFLEEEVFQLGESVGVGFCTEEQEISIYMDFRARAVDIEQTIFDLIKGEGKYPGDPMPQWRHLYYQDIVDGARELSVVLADCEEAEDNDEST